MTRTIRFASILGALVALATPAAAQQAADASNKPKVTTTEPAPATEKEKDKDKDSWTNGRTQSMQYVRPQDKRGLTTFETTKVKGAEFEGFKLDFGAAFTSQVQSLSHTNTASAVMANGVNTNQLANIGFGLNNSTANLNVNAQLAPGIRVALTTYLSSRHHNETWVKDGYLQFDESPIDTKLLNSIMKVVTLRMGHFEINYGDAHFRRSDNGNAVFNPFVGNYILDAFTTEIGAEAYLKKSNVIVMGAVTGGEIRGTVLNPGLRGPSYIGKLGFDRQINPDLRVRLTGSIYSSKKSMSNTLYGGDRAGSRYYYALENTAATEAAQATSGYLNPGFKNEVKAMQLNPFVKFRGLELFGVVERADGKATTEASRRTWNQYAVDAVYRLMPDEKLYVGARFNRANGNLVGITDKVGANRWQFGAGWFVTTNILMKAEYVNQKYFGFPVANIKNGGMFKGMMFEGVIAF